MSTLLKRARRPDHHSARAQVVRYRVLKGAVTMGGASDMATALRMMAVLSRDGELDGFRIVAREARR